jgi:hypothetical protein
MNDVNPEIREVGNKRQLYIRGKMVIEGFDIMLLNDKMYSEKLSIHRGPDNLRDRGADFRWYWDGVDGNYFNLYKGLDDRYWFYLVDKSYSRERYYHENGYRHIMDDGTVERFDIIVKGEYDTGLIAVDTETGSYTVLLPFQYDITFTVNPRGITPIGGQPEVTSTINSRRQGQRGGGDNWRFDGSTQIVFRKQ